MFLQTRNYEAEQAAKADGNYDILKNTSGLERPEEIEFDAGKLYWTKFKKQVGEH